VTNERQIGARASIGVRIRELPLVPARVLAALAQAAAGAGDAPAAALPPSAGEQER